MRCERELAVVFRRIVDFDAQPIRLKCPTGPPSAEAHTLDDERIGRQLDRLTEPGRAIVCLESDIEQKDVEPEETGHRPGAMEHEKNAGKEAHFVDKFYQDPELFGTQAPM